MTNGPVLIDLADKSDEPTPDVAAAPPVPDPGVPEPDGAAMQAAARIVARPPSRLARWAWGLAAALVGAAISVAAWDFAMGLLARAPILGWAVTGVMAVLLLLLLLIALREAAAIARLGRVDELRRSAEAALATADLAAARKGARRLIAFYGRREETRWGRERLAERLEEQFDAAAVMALAEEEVLAPLDAAARAEVETAARQVATATALVPLALADVAVALTSSLRMIRRVAEIYGGRSGTLGSWRLTRAVFAHLVATGAVAVGDDLLEPILGGSVLSRLSRRFGEGLVNGALSARVGVAAMEVCRPVPFSARHRPSVRSIVGRTRQEHGRRHRVRERRGDGGLADRERAGPRKCGIHRSQRSITRSGDGDLPVDRCSERDTRFDLPGLLPASESGVGAEPDPVGRVARRAIRDRWIGRVHASGTLALGARTGRLRRDVAGPRARHRAPGVRPLERTPPGARILINAGPRNPA